MVFSFILIPPDQTPRHTTHAASNCAHPLLLRSKRVSREKIVVLYFLTIFIVSFEYKKKLNTRLIVKLANKALAYICGGAFAMCNIKKKMAKSAAIISAVKKMFAALDAKIKST